MLIMLATAQGAFYSYAQWERLSEEPQAAYIAGAFDSLIIYADDDARRSLSRHYSGCLGRSHMNNGQLATNVRSYAATRPELQADSVQYALAQYLQALCGELPKPQK